MHLGTKSYLKSNRNHTAKQTLNLVNLSYHLILSNFIRFKMLVWIKVAFVALMKLSKIR
jgi:hypothetical protein